MHQRLDSGKYNYSRDEYLSLISKQLNTDVKNIRNIQIINSGMSNNSFSFDCEGASYIFRCPGEGSSALTDRNCEKDVYNAISSLKETDDIIYFDEKTGIKISVYYTGARNTNAQDKKDVADSLVILRSLHKSGIKTAHHFNIIKKTNHYITNLVKKGAPINDLHIALYFKMRYIARLLKKIKVNETFCHVDCNPDNFIRLTDGTLKIIDWEYAGMGDPIMDISMYAIYSYYSKEDAEELLALYLERQPSDLEFLRLYSYIALGAFLWMLWTEYKESFGVEFGDYGKKMLEYAESGYEWATSMAEKCKEKMNQNQNGTFSRGILFIPLTIVLLIAMLLYMFPVQAANTTGFLNGILVNKAGSFYIITGLFMLGCCIFAASKYGNIKLGNLEKPRFSNFRWGSMIFTSTMAADILYWSLIEWVYYFKADPMAEGSLSLARHILISSSYPLFHWGPIPWSFYILPAAAYAYMFFVKNRTRDTLSEACRPIIKSGSDGIRGRLIDMIAIVGLLGGTATTFAVATPLIAESVNYLTGASMGKILTIIILLVIGIIFTSAVIFGMKAIANLAVFNVIVFMLLLALVFFLGPTRFIIENGLSGIGYMLNNFLSMATWTDPFRLSGDGTLGFPQQWTVFYWSYWIAWFVATPFFIARISEGRTIRNMISGAFFYGISGTFMSFIVFGNFGLYQQLAGNVDTVTLLSKGAAPAKIIVEFFIQLPFAHFILLLLAIVMVSFYASTFDAITVVIAGFCKKGPSDNDKTGVRLRIYWACVLVILPIALIWSESTLSMLQTVSIIAAFPLAIIMLIISAGFLRELKSGGK